jgi:hypothetical protein
MPRQLRYTSFRPGELEQRLRELAPQAVFTTPSPNGRDSCPLRKSHLFDVAFPDGKSGMCRYERGGPRWHLFHYTYADGAAMPRQSCAERLGNEACSIEHKGVELASLCYQEAIQVERDHYFRRASEPSDGSRKKRPERYRMKADKAKELAGKYALCARSLNVLLVVSAPFENIEEANAAWREKAEPRLLVACCNRLDRCWDVPKYNTLYATWDPREEVKPT